MGERKGCNYVASFGTLNIYPGGMMRNSSELFVSLMYRLKSFRDVTVLMFLLEVEANQKEYACSALVMAQRYLGHQISARQVEMAIKNLCDLELISTRVHANTKTYFKVNGEQVLALLNQPLPEGMPGLAGLNFPFLNEWSGSATKQPTVSV